MSLSTGAKKSLLFTPPLYNFDHLSALRSVAIVIAVNRIIRLQGSVDNNPPSLVERSEHGQKTQRAAQVQGRFSQVHAVETAAEFCCCRRDIGIAYGYCGCATALWRESVVSTFLQQVWQCRETYVGSQGSDRAWRQTTLTVFRQQSRSAGKCCAAPANYEAEQDAGKVGGRTRIPQNRMVSVEQDGANTVRYYSLEEIGFGKDGDASGSRFINARNGDLVNPLGSSLIRTLKMVVRCSSGTDPSGRETINSSSLIKSKGLLLSKEDNVARENLQFSQVCKIVLSLLRTRNEFLDGQTSWGPYQQGKRVVAEAVSYAALKTVRLAASWLFSSPSPDPRDICRQPGMEGNFNCPYGGTPRPIGSRPNGLATTSTTLGPIGPSLSVP